MSNPKTLSSTTPNVTLSGLINAYGSIGVYTVNGTPTTIDAAVFGPAPTHFTVHNTGTILSVGTTEFDAGIFLGASGTIFNTGTIEAGTGIAIFGTTGKSSLSNSGEILGTLGVGLIAFDAASVSNTGEIIGLDYGLQLVSGGNVTNAAKAAISGGDAVAIAAKLTATITNAGTLNGEYGGIFLQAGGKVTNSGLILQTNSNSAGGAIESYQAATITNTGLIEGGNGIKFNVGTPTSAAFITNSGTIDVISTAGQEHDFLFGTIEYGAGIYANIAGTIANTGTIFGNQAGIVFRNAAGTVANAGLVSSSTNVGIDLTGGGTVKNTGTIFGFEEGIYTGADSVISYISNAGYIAANAPLLPVTIDGLVFTIISTAIFDFDSASILNTGTIAGPEGVAIDLYAAEFDPSTGTEILVAGDVDNKSLVTGLYGIEFAGTAGVGGVQNSGTVLARNDGVFMLSANNQISNSGLIEATGTTFTYATTTYTAAGLRLKAGGTVTNAASGHISAPNADAINAYAAAAAIINDGTISAAKVGIFLAAGGSVQNAGLVQSGNSAIYNMGTASLAVYNAKTGLISGGHNGVNDFGAPGTLTNNGTIIATDTTFTNSGGSIAFSHGVLFQDGGTLTNASTGTIIGAVGIAIAGAAGGSVNNAGHVTSTSRAGIYLQFAGTVSNAATGTIGAARAGVDLYGGGLVSNAGVIDAGHSAIYLKTGGTAVNTGAISAALAGIYALAPATVTNAGTIRGGTDGIDLAAGGTIIDTGTIIGAAYAISFATGPADRLVVNAAADIIGSINGGNGILELAADGKTVGTVTTARQAQFANFGSLQIDSGAIWDFAGAFTIAGPNPLLNDGTIKEAKTDTLTIDSALSGTGSVDLSKKPLTLNGAVASTDKISFTGTGESLDLGDPQAFAATIDKFKLGDTIDLTGITLSAITATHFAAGVLTLDEGTIKLDFTFANPATFGSDTFKLTAAGHGTAITLAAPAAALLPVTHVTTLAPLTTFTT